MLETVFGLFDTTKRRNFDMASKEPAHDKAEVAPKSGGKKKIIILVVLGLLLVGISVGGTFAVLKMLAPPVKEASGKDEEHAPKEDPEHPAHATYIDLPPAFLVNFQAGSKNRYLQMDISLLTMDPLAAEDMKVHLPLIRNVILGVINEQNFEGLQTAAGKETLRAAILEKVKTVLEQEIKKTAVEQVFFTSFVMQ
jgi:flagellar FliL protein